MEAQISPLLGLTLLGLLEVLTFFGVLATAGLAGVIWWTQCKMRGVHENQLKHQVGLAEHQKKLDSAHLILKLDKELTSPETRKFVYILDKIPKIPPAGDIRNKLAQYLGHVDMICMFYGEGLIDEHHMEEQYDPLIRDCCKDKKIVEYLRDKDPAYAPLKNRMVQLEPNVFDLP